MPDITRDRFMRNLWGLGTFLFAGAEKVATVHECRELGATATQVASWILETCWHAKAREAALTVALERVAALEAEIRDWENEWLVRGTEVSGREIDPFPPTALAALREAEGEN